MGREKVKTRVAVGEVPKSSVKHPSEPVTVAPVPAPETVGFAVLLFAIASGPPVSNSAPEVVLSEFPTCT